MKPFGDVRHVAGEHAAAFRRLCVETSNINQKFAS